MTVKQENILSNFFCFFFPPSDVSVSDIELLERIFYVHLMICKDSHHSDALEESSSLL